MNLRWLSDLSIDQIFAPASNNQRAGNDDLVKVLRAHWAALLVKIVECNGNSGLGDASLPLLVDELLQTVGTHL